MKVGIVSIYDDNNLGNRLQNYALQEKLMERGHKTQTLWNAFRVEPWWQRIKRKSYFVRMPLLRKIQGKAKQAELVRFNIRHIRLSKNCYWFNEDNLKLHCYDQCQLYCSGSDQIWNPHFGRMGMFNYLGFAERGRTFSYAASFGVDEIPEEYVENVRKGLNHIKFISVREDAGKRIVEELTGRTDVQVLVDPTMLLTPDQWDTVSEKPKAKLPEKYLLTYFLGDVSQKRRKAIEAKATELGFETIWLMDKNSPFYAIGPGHFVYLIKHAQMVCTDSFHGSVFSFLYDRPLAIFDRQGAEENMSSRLETLAAKFGLHDNMVQNESLETVPVETDYSQGYLALEEERKKSKAFLDMVFKEAERAGLCK